MRAAGGGPRSVRISRVSPALPLTCTYCSNRTMCPRQTPGNPISPPARPRHTLPETPCTPDFQGKRPSWASASWPLPGFAESSARLTTPFPSVRSLPPRGTPSLSSPPQISASPPLFHSVPQPSTPRLLSPPPRCDSHSPQCLHASPAPPGHPQPPSPFPGPPAPGGPWEEGRRSRGVPGGVPGLDWGAGPRRARGSEGPSPTHRPRRRSTSLGAGRVPGRPGGGAGRGLRGGA